MKKRIVAASLFALACIAGHAQSADKFIKQGEYAFYDENFQLALEIWAKMEAKYPEEKRHLYNKYIAEHLTNKRGSDLSNLLAFEATKGRSDKFYNYWMGRIHMLRYEFDEARERFNALLKMKVFLSDEIKEEIRFLLKWIDRVEPYHLNPDEYDFEHLPAGINTEFSEISPAFFNESRDLLFASDRDFEGDRIFETSEYQIYHAQRDGDAWTPAKPLVILGTFSYDNSKVEIIEKDQRVYIYDPKAKDLLYSHYDHGEWSTPAEFDTKIRSKQLQSHFFINDEENVILYAAGDKDDHDIWQTRLIDGKWTTPEPIPGQVNSSYFDDDSPFLSHNGKILYFSSNREESLGGYDIYRSRLDTVTGKWSAPENMGFPINTMDDDINFEMTPSDLSGYLSSNRLHSLGSFDLYFFKVADKITIKGVVLDKKTNQLIEGVTVEFHPSKYEDEQFVGKTDALGEYTTKIFNEEEFKVEVYLHKQKLTEQRFKSYIPLHSDHLTLNLEVDIPEELRPKTTTVAQQPAVEKPTEEPQEDYSEIYKGNDKEENIEIEMIGNKFRAGQKAIVNNIYFDFESAKLKPESDQVLDLILATMNKHPKLRVEIAGHTDNIGTESFNLTLSQKRAEAVTQYLSTHGISADRLVPKGYGEAFPMASNDDEKNGRELNRRIEIIVLE